MHVLAYLLGAHVLALVLTSLFRVVQWFVLHGIMGNGTAASVVPAFIRGIWFDNVIGCYILIVPLTVLLLAASFGYCAGWLRRAAGWWLGIFYTLVLAVSAANIPYFAYFFKNIDASIFGWFGYAGTTAGMLVGETSYWAYFALFII